VVEAVTIGAHELDVDLLGRHVDVIEAEVMIRDEAAIALLDLVKVRAARAGDDEA